MHDSPIRIATIAAIASLTLLGALCVAGPVWAAKPAKPPAGEPPCSPVRGIEGSYQCSGECIVNDASAAASPPHYVVKPVSGEIDRVERFPGADAGMYRITITGTDGFREVEIGPLVGRTLSAATAEVSDNHYPVLEDYVFQSGARCIARGYRKIVRNPSEGHFKSCVIDCVKQ